MDSLWGWGNLLWIECGEVCLTPLDLWVFHLFRPMLGRPDYLIQNVYHTFWMFRKVWIERNLHKIARSEACLTPSINECSSHLVVEDPDDWNLLWIRAGEIRLLWICSTEWIKSTRTEDWIGNLLWIECREVRLHCWIYECSTYLGRCWRGLISLSKMFITHFGFSQKFG